MVVQEAEVLLQQTQEDSFQEDPSEIHVGSMQGVDGINNQD